MKVLKKQGKIREKAENKALKIAKMASATGETDCRVPSRLAALARSVFFWLARSLHCAEAHHAQTALLAEFTDLTRPRPIDTLGVSMITQRSQNQAFTRCYWSQQKSAV